MVNQILTKRRTISRLSHLLPTTAERILIWEKARGVWKQKKPDPIRELARMRREWNRKLPAPHRHVYF